MYYFLLYDGVLRWCDWSKDTALLASLLSVISIVHTSKKSGGTMPKSISLSRIFGVMYDDVGIWNLASYYSKVHKSGWANRRLETSSGRFFLKYCDVPTFTTAPKLSFCNCIAALTYGLDAKWRKKRQLPLTAWCVMIGPLVCSMAAIMFLWVISVPGPKLLNNLFCKVLKWKQNKHWPQNWFYNLLEKCFEPNYFHAHTT